MEGESYSQFLDSAFFSPELAAPAADVIFLRDGQPVNLTNRVLLPATFDESSLPH
jgi:hypothetical protein